MKESEPHETLLFYRNVCGAHIMATVATVATGENNFLGSIVFGTFAIGDFWSTTKALWKRYKEETNYRAKHSRAA